LQRYLRAGDRVLDIGSGCHFSYLVNVSIPGLKWMPTDMTENVVEVTGRHSYTYSPVALRLQPGAITLPVGDLDAATLFEVVEHLPWNPCPLLGSVNTAMRRDGLLFISTPN